MIEWVALAASLVIACAGALIVLKGQPLELETRFAAEYVPRSASLRLVSLVVRELARCAAMYVAVAAMLLASVMAAATVSTSVVYQQVHFESPGIVGAAVCSSLEPCLEPRAYWRGVDVAVVQVVKWIDVGGGARVMPILAKCLARCPSRALTWCTPLCTASRGYLVLSSELQRLAKLIEPGRLGALGVVFANLSPVVETMVAPSTPLSPGLGIVGGIAVFIKNPSSVAIAPLNPESLGAALRGGASARCILLSFRETPPPSLARHCVLVKYIDGVAVITSGFRAPTPKSLASLALCVSLAVLIAASACGGIAEKMRRFCSALVVQGASLDTITVSISMGSLALSALAIPLSFSIPYAISGEWLSGGVGLATYLASALALSTILSRRVARAFRAYPHGATSISLEVASRKSLDEVLNCVRKSLESDDNFVLSEAELLPLDSRVVLRLELVYRKAMAILVSVEVEMEVQSGRLRILYASSDVWSFEELGEISRTVSRLAISRAVGTLWLCSES